MNIAKKISASANCRYGDPPATVKKKVPSKAIAPTTAHTAVTTLEVRLANMRASPFVRLLTRRKFRDYTTPVERTEDIVTLNFVLMPLLFTPVRGRGILRS